MYIDGRFYDEIVPENIHAVGKVTVLPLRVFPFQRIMQKTIRFDIKCIYDDSAD